ncbi:MAG: hypothetical protein CBC48_05005 [bacterium TMED88]|nr:acyl-CoA dehydrogenase [Deltaproteobacteria bacterium]OUV34909.1 MAG: hypothetical protein CBC48_05005 [bacterium TMED88]
MRLRAYPTPGQTGWPCLARRGDPLDYLEAMDLDSTELLKKAHSLVPLLKEHAPSAEQKRKPSDEVIEALRESGIFEMMVPRAYGGLELDLDCFLEVGLTLAEGDASMSWVATFYIEHNWMLCQFPEAFQRELFADRTHVLAPASLAPGGRVQPAENGYRLSGQWSWNTGIVHADWVMLGVMMKTPDAKSPDVRLFAVPKSQVEVLDTWRTDGMAATGSHDIRVNDVFVPAERTVNVTAMATGKADGARLHSGPLYRTPMIPILALAASMPAVGQARAAVRQQQEQMTNRRLYGAPGFSQSDKPASQIRLARADLQVRQSELLMRDVVREVMAVRQGATLAQRARWTGSLALAVDQSKRALQSLSEAAGASAHFLDHPLQRALRDVNMMATHVIFDLDQRLEIHGRALLGLEPSGLL